MKTKKHILIVHTAADPQTYIPRLRELGYTFTLMKKRPTVEDELCFDHVIDIDFQADTDVTIEAARELNARQTIDGVMSFSESGVVTASLIAWALGLPGNHPGAALRARNKYLMREALRKSGLNTPPYFLVRDAKTIRKLVREHGPMVLKPISGSSSYGVIRIVPEDTEQVIAGHLDAVREYIVTYRDQNPQYPFEFWLPEAGRGISPEAVMDPSVDFLLEGFIGGQQVSVDGIVSHGKVTCLGVIEIERIADQDYFLEYEEWMPTRFGDEREAEIQSHVRRAVRSLGLWQGAFHCELKVEMPSPSVEQASTTPPKITVIEIAARRGADNISDFVQRVMGVDVYEEGMRLACGEHREFPGLARKGAMKMRYFIPDASGTLVSIEGADEVRNDPRVSELVFEFGPGDGVLTPPDGYEFLGYVSVFGETLDEACETLEEAYEKVQFNIDRAESPESAETREVQTCEA